MGQRQLDGLLRDWAAAILAEIDKAYANETSIYKMMKCGIIAQSGMMPVPNYWPKPYLVKFHDAICSIPVKYRNYFVAKFIIRIEDKTKLAEHCNVERMTIWRWEKADGKPYRLLLNAYA